MLTRRQFAATVPIVTSAGRSLLFARPATQARYTFVDLRPFATDGVTVLPGWFDPVQGLANLPSGETKYFAVPFRLIERGAPKRIIVLDRTRKHCSLPVAARCHHVVFAHFCDRHPDDTAGPFGPGNAESRLEPVSQLLATYTLVYRDGTRHGQAIRRRFEINPPRIDPSHVPAAAKPGFEEAFVSLDAPLDSALNWAEVQTAQARRIPPDFGPVLWVYDLPNPHPDREIATVELSAAGEHPLAVCGITLFHLPQHPLQRDPLKRLQITLPAPVTDFRNAWNIELDLGMVARVSPDPEFDPRSWLADPYKGLGAPAATRRATRKWIVEVTASPAASLSLKNKSTGETAHYSFPSPAIEFIEPRTTWIHGRVIDADTRSPSAVRLAFRSSAGRYVAPYGHAEDINTGCMQNTSPDVKIGGASYAYVDGEFQIELPVGDVFVEVSKGFEYTPLRARLPITPGQRELTVQTERAIDSRKRGWHTADTHVHIGAPGLLVLEGAAEGLDLVNLLAAQWGRHFTNFADRPGRFEGSTADTTVWVGSENRNHFLGHIGLLGLRKHILPFSDSGPPVAYFGSPLTHALAEWADECRSQGGLTVGVHFPIPNGETAVDVILGKLDSAEIRFDHGFAGLGVTEYYRYLSAGYRLAAVGGTDKMFPTRAVGAVRTYARLQPGEPFRFDQWAQAVRSGRTFVTTGPLLYLAVDGKEPGEEIEIGSGAILECRADVESVYPAGDIELVLNGKVVARGMSPLRENVKVQEAGWIAARCNSARQLSYGMRSIGAHTSPVYLNKRGESCFSVATGEYLMKLVEGSILWLDTLAVTTSEDHKRRIRALFHRAKRELADKLHSHFSHRHL